MLDGEVVSKTICDLESSSYVVESAGYDDGYLYRMYPYSSEQIQAVVTNKRSELTLTQIVTLSGTDATVKSVSKKSKTLGDKVTGKSYAAANIIVQASTAVA